MFTVKDYRSVSLKTNWKPPQLKLCDSVLFRILSVRFSVVHHGSSECCIVVRLPTMQHSELLTDFILDEWIFSVFCNCAHVKPFCWFSRSRPWRVSWALCGICRLTASTTRWRSVLWTELWASWSARWRTDVRPTRSPSSRAVEGSYETCRVWSPHEKTTGECPTLTDTRVQRKCLFV